MRGIAACYVDNGASTFFDTRNAPNVTAEKLKFFRSYLAKLLYLAKRMAPECRVAVAFLTKRVNALGVDDVTKHKYLHATRYRDIILCYGTEMIPHAHNDAANGVN